MVLSFWLTSLCIMGSSFIHLIRTDSNEFLLKANIPWCICTTASLSNCLADGHLGCFHVLAIINIMSFMSSLSKFIL